MSEFLFNRDTLTHLKKGEKTRKRRKITDQQELI